MKKSKYIILIMISLLCASHVVAKENAPLDTEDKKLSYSFGHKMGKIFGENKDMNLDVDAFLSGVRDALLKNKTLITQDEMDALEANFQQSAMKQQEIERIKLTKENSAKGKAFMEANKKRKKVVTLSQGIQYEIIKAGKGKQPKLKDQVVAHYKGSLLSGKEFANTYTKGRPPTFYLNRVFEGWKKIFPKMKEGSIWKLYLAPEYAYGKKGVPPIIGPEETLIFEIELLEITKVE